MVTTAASLPAALRLLKTDSSTISRSLSEGGRVGTHETPWALGPLESEGGPRPGQPDPAGSAAVDAGRFISPASIKAIGLTV
jgi:hypothetical protein